MTILQVGHNILEIPEPAEVTAPPFPPVPQSIACGGITDVQGNLALFNCLSVGNLQAIGGASLVTPSSIVSVSTGATVSVNSGTMTSVLFPTVAINTNPTYVAPSLPGASNNGVQFLTTGIYLLIGFFQFIGSTDGSSGGGSVRRIVLNQNNPSVQLVTGDFPPQGTSNPPGGSVTIIGRFATGSFITVQVYQDSGNAQVLLRAQLQCTLLALAA